MSKFTRGLALMAGVAAVFGCAGCGSPSAHADDVPTYTVKNPPQTAATASPTSPATNAPGTAVPPAAAPTAAPGAGTAPVPGLAVVPQTLQVTPALAEVIRLLQGGVSEEVLMAYVTNSSEIFNVGADEILYLHDLGAPSGVLTALIQKDTSPEILAKKKAAAAVTPLPPGVGLTKPAQNLYTSTSTPSGGEGAPLAAAAVTNNPPAPTPVNPPRAAEVPAATEVAYNTEPPPQQPVTVNYFYSELAPYGSWVEVGGYGRCWRPTVAVWNSTWRPYCDGGRWLWSDNGWYWYSDYSWGWAPFHYGRWTCPAGVGWVWVPDTCWGPAWVSWRTTSSHCGWAPLPPAAIFRAGHGFYHHGVSVDIGFHFGLAAADFIFLPFGRFCEPRLTAHRLTATHSAALYRDSKPVHNAVAVNKATVVNNGVGYDRVASATRGNIRRVALKDTTDMRDTTTRREVLDADGKTLSVYRPSADTLASRPANGSSILHPRPARYSNGSGSAGSATIATGSGGNDSVGAPATRPVTGSTFLAPRPATTSGSGVAPGAAAGNVIKPASATVVKNNGNNSTFVPRNADSPRPTPPPPSGRPQTVIVRSDPSRAGNVTVGGGGVSVSTPSGSGSAPAPVIRSSPVIHAPPTRAAVPSAPSLPSAPSVPSAPPPAARHYAPAPSAPSAPAAVAPRSAPIHSPPVSRSESSHHQPPASRPAPAESSARSARSSSDDGGRRGR